MSRLIRNLWIAIGIWALVIIATVVFYFELWNAFYFFTSYWIIGCRIAGLIIAGVTLYRFSNVRRLSATEVTENTEKSLCPLCALCSLWLFIHMKTAIVALFKDRPRLPAALAMILIVALFFLLIKGPDGNWGALPRFYLSKSSYQTTVAKLRAARVEAERQAICAGKCEFELGPSGTVSRVVFPWTYDDVLLGWTGVVYDPEGQSRDDTSARGQFLRMHVLRRQAFE